MKYLWLTPLLCFLASIETIECDDGIVVVVKSGYDDDGYGSADSDSEAGTNSPDNGVATAPTSGGKEYKCGVPTYKHNLSGIKKIIKGSRASQGSWPWQVGILLEDEFSCGGTIITKQFVVTAAHCVVEDKSGVMGADEVAVLVGATYRHLSETWRKKIEVENISPHEGYQETGTKFHDIAVLKLKTEVVFNDYVIPLCLPLPNQQPSPGEKCVVTGWGATKDNPSEEEEDSDYLLQVKVATVSDESCRNIYHGDVDPELNICAGGSVGDTCQGDSGGPFQCKKSDDEPWYLAGVTAWGKGCGAGMPGVYTQVEHYLTWIYAIIG